VPRVQRGSRRADHPCRASGARRAGRVRPSITVSPRPLR
jgi:hypothetical protein